MRLAKLLTSMDFINPQLSFAERYWKKISIPKDTIVQYTKDTEAGNNILIECMGLRAFIQKDRISFYIEFLDDETSETS